MRKRDLLVALHQKRQKMIAREFKEILMEKPKRDAFMHPVPVVPSRKDINSRISALGPGAANSVETSKAVRLDLVPVGALSRYQNNFGAMDEFKEKYIEDYQYESFICNRQLVNSFLERESNTPSHDAIPLVVVGKPVTKVSPKNNFGKQSPQVKDYFERRIARNRAKSDNRSYGVACAPNGILSNKKKELIHSVDRILSVQYEVEEWEKGGKNLKVHRNGPLEVPHLRLEIKKRYSRPPDGVPSLTYVLEQLKASSSQLFTLEAPSPERVPSKENVNEPKQRLIQRKKDLILKRINSCSTESDSSDIFTNTVQPEGGVVFTPSVGLVNKNRKAWDKSPIVELLEKMSSGDLDLGKPVTANDEGENLKENNEATSPQQAINMNFTLVLVKNEADNSIDSGWINKTNEASKCSLSSFLTFPDLSHRSYSEAHRLQSSMKRIPIVKKTQAASLQMINLRLLNESKLGMRFSVDEIRTLSLDTFPSNLANPSPSASASTLMCSAAESPIVDPPQVLSQATANPQELFNSKRYTTQDPLKQIIQRSQSQPSQHDQGVALSPTLTTAVHSSWYSLFEETNETWSQVGSSEINEDLWEEQRDPTLLTSASAHYCGQAVTDSGFTTPKETPHLSLQISTPGPLETERMPTLYTTWLQILENDGDEQTDFAEWSTIMPESQKEKPLSRFFIAEQIRFDLERVLELETLIKCYNVVQNLQDSEDNELHMGRESIASLVGQSRASEVFDKVLQLVLIDGAYADSNLHMTE